MRWRRVTLGICILLAAGCKASQVAPISAENDAAALVAVRAVDFCTEGCVRAAFVNPTIRLAERSPFESPNRLPVVASIKRADIEALSTSRLYFFAADSLDLGKDRVGADTAALHIIRVGSASDSVVYGIIVTGRPFAFNYVAMVVLRRSGNRWIAMTPSYFVE